VLESFGVDIIEAGFAAGLQRDFDSVKAIVEKIRNCSLVVEKL